MGRDGGGGDICISLDLRHAEDLEDLCSRTVKCKVRFFVPLPCCNVETKWMSMNTET